MKIAAVVILYHPANSFFQSLKKLQEKVGRLYVVNNTENIHNSFETQLPDLKDIKYFYDGENRGISQRLNDVAVKAKKDGYNWLLTMDQDSAFNEVMLERYFNCIEEFKGVETVSIFGITYNEKEYKNARCTPLSVNHLITSGSVLNLRLFEKIGEFDENLFIDEVDFEYCLRSRHKGYQIIQFRNIFMNHQLGTTVSGRSLKDIRRSKRVIHSPGRIYYMTRNYFYIRAKYKDIFKHEIEQRKSVFWNRLKNNILYNPERIKVVRYFVKGIMDYKKNRMGKLK